MENKLKISYILYSLHILIVLYIESTYGAKIVLRDFKNCEDFKSDHNALDMKYIKTTMKAGGKCSVKGNFSVTEQIGENFNVVMELFVSMSGKRFVKVMTDKKNDPCKQLQINMGPVWADIQRSVKMPVGHCPLEKGTYNINTELDLSKVPFPIPPGVLKLLINGFNIKQNNRRSYCIEINLKAE